MYAGEIPATLHARVLEQYQAEVIPGSIVILSKVVVREYIILIINMANLTGVLVQPFPVEEISEHNN